jgi:hypothetical protein
MGANLLANETRIRGNGQIDLVVLANVDGGKFVVSVGARSL